ncbi:hypothetical protein AB1K70_23450 [Bremerella sp. JC770]|uniref:hypothetical protein n=1 Tax=Bremerella sp. JC770 TaxID=3232137 RepID=UPI00345905BE
MPRLACYCLTLFSLSVLFLATGCQKQDGPVRYEISGTVTYEGAPVPGGSIVFTPDSKKGNNGPQGTARIVDGRYDTANYGRGTVGGPHQVHVIATDATTTEAAELTGPLAEHTFQIDIPLDETTQDLDIPPRRR